MKKILIIDDDNGLRTLYSKTLENEGFKVFGASTLKSGWEQLEAVCPDLLILDVQLPDGNGVDFTEKVKLTFPKTIILILTGYSSVKDGVRAIKLGAYNYIDKSEPRIQLLSLIQEALASNEPTENTIKLTYVYKPENKIIGSSPSLTKAMQMANKFAQSEISILLTGETGSGKELFAEKIHSESLRCKKKFVAINCSAIPKDLLESEFFGHVKGAFSGAHRDKTGYFEEANNGTLFLDEISEMNIDLQSKILRVLENSTFTKVGDTKPIKVNVRLISACNRKIEQMIKEGLFREDLYYRISGVKIEIPSLKERNEDIKEIAEYFLRRFEAQSGKSGLTFSMDFLKALERHHWPGNVRELRNIIYRSVILSDSQHLSADLLPQEIIGNKKNVEEYRGFSLEEVDKAHIEKVLNLVNGNKVEAANLLSIGLTTLYRKIQEYKLESQSVSEKIKL